MDAQILIAKAKEASEQRDFFNDEDRLAFRVGYLETTIKLVCNLFTDAEEIMYRQRELIEEMRKGNSADL